MEKRAQGGEWFGMEGERFRSILDVTPFPLAVVDEQDSRILFWNKAARLLFGHTPPTVEEWYRAAYPDPHYREQVIAQWMPALEKARLSAQAHDTGEYRVTCQDGSVRICELYAAFLPGNLIVTFVDISARKKAENEARENAQLYRELVENANSAIIRWRKDGSIVFFNEFAQKFFGYALDEVIGKDINILVPRQESTGRDLSTLVQDILVCPERYINNMNENVCKDGRRVWMTWTNKAILGEKGQVEEILCIGSDITARKQTADSLRQSEEMNRSIIDNVGVGIAVISPEMKILSLNNQMKKWFPRIDPGQEPVCYRAFNNPPREDVCAYCPTAKTLQDGLVHEDMTETPVDGGVVNYRIISSPIKDENGKIVAAIEMVDDISERRKMERESQKHLEEMEIFYKASIGRESRILELKKEIERLKAQLANR